MIYRLYCVLDRSLSKPLNFSLYLSVYGLSLTLVTSQLGRPSLL